MVVTGGSQNAPCKYGAMQFLSVRFFGYVFFACVFFLVGRNISVNFLLVVRKSEAFFTVAFLHWCNLAACQLLPI